MELDEFKDAVVRLMLGQETPSQSDTQFIHKELELDSLHAGFVMSRDQYNHYTTQVMFNRTACPAMYRDAFYPKSSHMIPEPDRIFSDYVKYLLPAITRQFPYYYWSFGPATPEEWRKSAPKFQKLTDGPVVFIWHRGNESNLYAVHKRTKKVICAPVWISGGRLYCEDVASECCSSREVIV